MIVNKILIIGLALLLMLSSCQKSNNDLVLDVAKLAEQATKEDITDNEFQKITEQYKKLSNTELELFFSLSLQIMQENCKNIDLSPEEINQITDFRKQVFQKSIELFNKSFNQLSPDEAKQITDLIKDSKSFSRSSCNSATYSGTVCRTTSFDTYWEDYKRYSTPDDPSDCDYEYKFKGRQYSSYGATWFDRKLIDHWGSCGILKRYHSGYTRLLFGQLGVYLWIGHPYLFSVRMK